MSLEQKTYESALVLGFKKGDTLDAKSLSEKWRAFAYANHPDKNGLRDAFIQGSLACEELREAVRKNRHLAPLIIQNPETLIIDRANAYEDEIRLDPEAAVFANVAASKKAAFAELFFFIVVGLGLGLCLRHYMLELRLSPLKYRYLYPVATFAPAVILGFLRAKSLYLKFLSRFEVSRRYVRSEVFAGITIVESCDLSKIKDVVLTNMGPVSSLKIISTDISAPTIEMNFLETGLAKEIFGFLTAHSLDT